jgi:hypothetical protein
MNKTKLDETYIFEINIKIWFFYVSIGIKIPFFRVSVTIEPSRSLLTVRYHELFEKFSWKILQYKNVASGNDPISSSRGTDLKLPLKSSINHVTVTCPAACNIYLSAGRPVIAHLGSKLNTMTLHNRIRGAINWNAPRLIARVAITFKYLRLVHFKTYHDQAYTSRVAGLCMADWPHYYFEYPSFYFSFRRNRYKQLSKYVMSRLDGYTNKSCLDNTHFTIKKCSAQQQKKSLKRVVTPKT